MALLVIYLQTGMQVRMAVLGHASGEIHYKGSYLTRSSTPLYRGAASVEQGLNRF